MAAALVGIGLLIGWTCKMSYHQQVVQDVPRQVLPAEPETVLVGRITGMVDCRWADTVMEASPGDTIPLGRRYATLAAGLVEITYNTGAQSILQGSTTYEVDSVRGGFLSLGS